MEETRNDEEDRISRLPDSLIHCIMSFIDTRYAVQTSVLSKRWIHTWKSLPFLNLNQRSFEIDERNSPLMFPDIDQKFINFVDKVFDLRDDLIDIQTCLLHWLGCRLKDDTVTRNVNRWIIEAAKHNVQEMTIEISKRLDSAYEIPHQLLNCKSLRKLRMVMCYDYWYVILPESIDLPQLKELSLYGISISDVESCKKLFSSCPVLETLKIINCGIETGNRRNLIIDSVSLKQFTYTWHDSLFWGDHTAPNSIKLCAPNLENFTLKCLLTRDSFTLENSSPLSKVDLDMYFEEETEDYPSTVAEEAAYAKRIMKLLGAVFMAKEMRLSSEFLQILSGAPELSDCQPPHLCNLQRLVLEMRPTKCCLRAIAYLLYISPNIVKLALASKEVADVGEDGEAEFSLLEVSHLQDVQIEELEGWEAGLSSPGMLSHLESVEFKDLEGCDAELELLSFLFKNAEVLETVALTFRSSNGLPDRVRKIAEFKKKIRAVHSASPSIRFVFKTY